MVKSVRACKEWRDDPNFTNFPTSTWTKLLKWGFVIVWLPKVKFIKLTILIESIFFKNDIHHNFQTIYHALDAWVNSTCTIFPSDETCWPLVTGLLSMAICHVTKLIIQQLTICILSPLLLTTDISPDMCDADFECWDSLLLYCWPSFSAFSLVSSLFHRFPFKLDFFLFLAVIFSVLTSHFIFL